MNKKLLIALLSIVVLLSIAHIYANNASETFRKRFDMNFEGNIPTWFSTILLFSIAGYSHSNFQFEEDKGDQSSRRVLLFWGVMVAVFLFFSLDEAAQIHELFDELSIIKWVFAYAPLGIVFIYYVFYHLFRVNQDKEFRIWMTIGFITFVLGGYVLETLSYLLAPLPPYIQKAEYLLEESMEMIGAIIILLSVREQWKKLRPKRNP